MFAQRGRCPLLKLLHLQRDVGSGGSTQGVAPFGRSARGLWTNPPSSGLGWPSAILTFALRAAHVGPDAKVQIVSHLCGYYKVLPRGRLRKPLLRFNTLQGVNGKIRANFYGKMFLALKLGYTARGPRHRLPAAPAGLLLLS